MKLISNYCVFPELCNPKAYIDADFGGLCPLAGQAAKNERFLSSLWFAFQRKLFTSGGGQFLSHLEPFVSNEFISVAQTQEKSQFASSVGALKKQRS